MCDEGTESVKTSIPSLTEKSDARFKPSTTTLATFKEGLSQLDFKHLRRTENLAGVIVDIMQSTRVKSKNERSIMDIKLEKRGTNYYGQKFGNNYNENSGKNFSGNAEINWNGNAGINLNGEIGCTQKQNVCNNEKTTSSFNDGSAGTFTTSTVGNTHNGNNLPEVKEGTTVNRNNSAYKRSLDKIAEVKFLQDAEKKEKKEVETVVRYYKYVKSGDGDGRMKDEKEGRVKMVGVGGCKKSLELIEEHFERVRMKELNRETATGANRNLNKVAENCYAEMAGKNETNRDIKTNNNKNNINTNNNKNNINKNNKNLNTNKNNTNHNNNINKNNINTNHNNTNIAFSNNKDTSTAPNDLSNTNSLLCYSTYPFLQQNPQTYGIDTKSNSLSAFSGNSFLSSNLLSLLESLQVFYLGHTWCPIRADALETFFFNQVRWIIV